MDPGDLYSVCTSHLLHNLGQVALHFPASFLLPEIRMFYLLLVKHFKI